MKTIRYERYGAPEVLQLTKGTKPIPQKDELLIKVHATSVTVADVRLRAFNVPPAFWIPARLMLGIFRPKRKVLGAELAGTVEAVGKAVTKFKVGDKVFAGMGRKFGAYAEYVCASEDQTIAILPKNLTFEEAATIPVGARTALHYLRRASIQPKQKVLIYGASGSVGTYAVQLAKYFGAKDLQFLSELAEAGKLKPVIDRCYSMIQIVEAHRYVDRGHKKGNVAISIS